MEQSRCTDDHRPLSNLILFINMVINPNLIPPVEITSFYRRRGTFILRVIQQRIPMEGISNMGGMYFILFHCCTGLASTFHHFHQRKLTKI